LTAMNDVHFTAKHGTYSYGEFYMGFGLFISAFYLLEAWLAWFLDRITSPQLLRLEIGMLSINGVHDLREHRAHDLPDSAPIGMELLLRASFHDDSHRVIQLRTVLQHELADGCCGLFLHGVTPLRVMQSLTQFQKVSQYIPVAPRLFTKLVSLIT